MRVVCQTISEFLENLEHEPDDAVLQKTIRVSCILKFVHEAKSEIIVQASAVVSIGEEGQYLLEAGEICGMDYKDASGECQGTDKAEYLRGMIKEVCDRRGWSIRPGIIDM